jgi:hypothetical protein
MTDKTVLGIGLESMGVPKMQRVSVGDSAAVPVMQLAPSKPTTPQQTTQNAAGNNSSNKNGK